MLGLPDDITALLFDLDGVLTPTAKIHFKAWKQTFDEFLRQRDGDSFKEFTQDDYNEYVDGMSRFDGVRSFLKSRDIELPEGADDDDGSFGEPTVHGLGNRKNDLVLELIQKDGVEPYPGSLKYVKAAQEAGLARAVVSASANCRPVLRSAGIEDLFDAIIDGKVADEQHLQGKPHPDTYLAGAKALSVDPSVAAVFEDATAGVQAGHDGHFGYVVGVDRVDHAAALKSHGADVVVKDLADLL
ncbi:MAG TPA: beta-phosphoglucomutase family hydrolase [Solirubrobacteraceae bacterium]